MLVIIRDKAYFIGWYNNHFNNLPFRTPLEPQLSVANKYIEYVFVLLLKRRLLK